jgi:hypothetical protein
MYTNKLKVADLNISEDLCGLYVFRIYGYYANHFEVSVRDKSLYLIKKLPVISGSVVIIVSLEDPSGVLESISRIYTLTLYPCNEDCLNVNAFF